jgi:hypothetical protein
MPLGDFFGGECYFNGAAMAIRELQKNFSLKRFAIIALLIQMLTMEMGPGNCLKKAPTALYLFLFRAIAGKQPKCQRSCAFPVGC